MTKRKEPWRCAKCNCFGVTIPRPTPRSKICSWCVVELTKIGERWCNRCKAGRTLDQFARPQARYCQICESVYNKAYRAEHREAMKAQAREAYHCNRDERLAYNRQQYAEKREQYLAQKRVYYQQNREVLKAKSRFHRLRRPPESIVKERVRQQAKRPIYKANERINAKLRLWRRVMGTVTVKRGEAYGR